MGKFDLYKIPLKCLSIGTHNYEYVLDNIFFKNIDGTEVQKGKIYVKLTVKKTSNLFELNFDLDGVAQVPCDRCLDDMEIPVSTKSRLFVKFGKEFSEESDEVVIIPEEEGEINLAWFMYEFIALAIPIKHVHQPGKCNKTMSSKLRKHITRSVDDDDEEDSFEDDEVIGNDDEIQTDPRWDDLKKLIDNN